MAISIVLNVSRARVLSRVAKKFQSQALEADALHFSSDVLSSIVVIAGLFFVSLGYPIADPFAALGVVAVVVWLSLQLGKRTIFALLDRAPEGLAGTIRAEVLKIPGVRSLGRVRVRPSGAQTFVDLEAFINRSTNFEAAHEIAVTVEQAIRKLTPNSDTVVRTIPIGKAEAALAEKARKLASRIHEIRGLHNIEVHDAEDGLHVELHFETDPDVRLETAHDIASKLESAIKTSTPEVAEVVTHIESADETPLVKADVTLESHEILRAVRETALRVPGVRGCRGVAVHSAEDGLHLTVTCTLGPNLAVSEAHEISTRIEEALRAQIEGTSRVLVHVEPDLQGGES
jgi:divalent metal cation (Fe/Co/Zn/Cd) transporter